jgi:hypothetical protein
MKNNLLRFLSAALIITGLLVFADGLAKKMWEQYTFQSGLPLILIFLFLYTLFHWYLLKMGSKEPKKFVNGFMAFSGIKLLILLGILSAFVYTHKEQKIPFLVLFMSAYFLHTANEIFWANRFVKKQNPS